MSTDEMNLNVANYRTLARANTVHYPVLSDKHVPQLQFEQKRSLTQNIKT